MYILVNVASMNKLSTLKKKVWWERFFEPVQVDQLTLAVLQDRVHEPELRVQSFFFSSIYTIYPSQAWSSGLRHGVSLDGNTH